MALFGSKKNTTVKKVAAPKGEKKVRERAATSEKKLANTKLETVLLHPWLSEKALIGTEKGVYVFAIPAHVTKTEILEAVERLYKVVPVKVNTTSLPGKSKTLRHARGYGRRAARHKAYVYLKKGETITFA